MKLEETTKYAKWYNKLVINPDTSGYTEKHHILPKSIFPEFKREPENLVNLSARQHFLAHFMLMKHYKSLSLQKEYSKMSFAFMRMQKPAPQVKGKSLKINSHTFEAMKINFSKASSIVHKGKIISEETKEKMRGPRPCLQGRKLTKEHRESLRQVNLGKVASQETKDKMSESHQKNKELYSQLASQRTGSKNSRAKTKTVYNELGEIMYVCHGNLQSVCDEHNLPYFALNKSFQSGGNPIYSTSQWKTKAKKLGLEKFIGWYSN